MFAAIDSVGEDEVPIKDNNRAISLLYIIFIFLTSFFIMNLFHALQYFGIVWWSEKGNMARLFRLQGRRLAQPMTLALFVGLTAAYGLGVQVMDTSLTALWALTLVVSVMHFWYDGFIWSVRRQQV